MHGNLLVDVNPWRNLSSTPPYVASEDQDLLAGDVVAYAGLKLN